MRQRRVRMAVVVLLASVLTLVAACGGSQPPPAFTGTDNEDSAPPEARDVMLNALQTMFTWSPAKDASTADAYNRALPFLGKELRDGANNRVERGNSPQWQEWKAEKAEVSAQAWLVTAEHPKDAPDTIQRAVVLTQTVKAPDGRELDSTTFNIDRVVAKKGPQGWRVETIAFFPENPLRTGTCPPGSSHQPPPDGPCAPIPPPPGKQCPDGTTIAPDQVCPAAQTGPKTKQCDDGTTVAVGSACPTTGTGPSSTTPCPSGQSPDANGKCVTPETTCPTGQTKDANGTCVTPETTCPSGQTLENGTCTTAPVTCAADETLDNGTCAKKPVTCASDETLENGTCTNKPVDCPDGTTVPNGQTCPSVDCPDGTTVPNGQTCKPVSCPDGSSVSNGQTCPRVDCHDGTAVPNGQTCPPKSCPDGSSVPNGGTCPQAKAAPPPPIAANCTVIPGPPGGFNSTSCTCPSATYSELHDSECYVPGSYTPAPGPRFRSGNGPLPPGTASRVDGLRRIREALGIVAADLHPSDGPATPCVVAGPCRP
jgi:hypothetical protein